MRRSPIAALAFALALGACSGGEEAEDEIATQDDAGGAQMVPGQYESRGTLLEFAVEGLSDSQLEPARALMAEGLAEPHSYCLTQEEIDQGPGQMAQKMAESDCSVAGIRGSGGVFNGEMVCRGEGGLEGTVKVEGTMNGNSSTVVIEATQAIPGVPGDGARMKMQVEAVRTGECAG